MKKFFVFCLTALLFASCSIDDGVPFTNVFLPVESVEIPDEFELGGTYPITVNYFRPTTCHAFQRFYYLSKNNERTVAPITYLFERSDCKTLQEELVEAKFNFTVISNGSYIFKFWQGEDADGEDQFLEIEVPVVN